eukprot:scaffold25380_cov36-Tisochrysis_lutea.AAC.1
MSTFRCTEFKQQQLFGKNAVASGLQLRLASAVSSRTWQARHTMRSKAKSAIAFDTTLGWSNSIQLSCPCRLGQLTSEMLKVVIKSWVMIVGEPMTTSSTYLQASTLHRCRNGT